MTWIANEQGCGRAWTYLIQVFIMPPQVPPIDSLQRPEKLSAALKADTREDCLSCKLTGESAIGLPY